MPAELTALLDAAEQKRRESHAMRPTVQSRPWFRMETRKSNPRTADVWIYDTIGPSFFDESTDAKSFTRDLATLDVDEITLHINSPGGDFFDGLAIYNALVDHSAKVTSVVDGLAASAASFIAQAGDVRRMNRAAQMMIHDASGIVVGNAADMDAMVEVLDRISDSIAGIYAARGGGAVADWRTAMRAETWYTAAEAVDAGLADEAVDEAPPEQPVRNSWDLAIFNYAGRQAAPPPVMPSAANSAARPETPAPVAEDSTPPIREGAVGMPDAAKLREALGLKADASDQEVTAAFAAAGFTAAVDPPPPAPPSPPAPPAPTNPPAGDPDPDSDPLPSRQATASGRVKVVDAAVWEKLNEQAAKVDELVQERQREKRDAVIADAMRAGKFGPAEKEHYQKFWDKAPQEAEQLIAALTPNRIAVNTGGYVAGLDPDESAEAAMFDELFPPEMRYGKAGSRG